MFTDFDEKLYMESRNTLERLKANLHNNHKTNKDLIFEAKQAWREKDKGRVFFEEFTPESFKSKMTVDLLYFNQLLQKLEENEVPVLEHHIVELYKIVREIYEFMNIKPEIYGKNVTEYIINESAENVSTVLSENIYRFLSNNYYNLTPEKRKELYFERVKQDIVGNPINEDIDSLITKKIKKCIMEDFIKSMCFPFSCMSRLNYLLEDAAFGDVFDQERLIELYSMFNNKVSEIADHMSNCV